ncbi:MAG: glycoside hydrolase [Bacteroidetes bacterium]|nr:glycoside hydrolase [Bacteroidota bacterium]
MQRLLLQTNNILSSVRKFRNILIIVAAVFFIYSYHKQIMRVGYKAYRYIKAKRVVPVYGKHQFSFPNKYAIHGVDISKWQDEINWRQLKSCNLDGDTIQMKFVFIKATEGALYEDPMFSDNWEAAKEVGIAKGAYHFYRPKINSTIQASNFIQSVQLMKGDLPPVIDIEETDGKSKKEIVKGLKNYIEIIEKKYGVKPIIYSNVSFIEDYLADDFSEYHFWVAHYYVSDLHKIPGIKNLFWQHHDKIRIFGCANQIDANVFLGDEGLWKKLLIK